MKRVAAVLASAVALVVVMAGPAFAHVKVNPESAPKGSDAVLGFVVPNEKDNATTTKVVVQFPTDHPIAAALVEAMPGWSASVADFHVSTPIQTDDGPVNSAVKSVTWTATDGKGIAVGDFAEFSVSVGLPDDADSLAFPTIQTYSDGSTVDWVQVSPPGGPEADTPEPVLTLTAGESAASTTPTTVAGTAASDTVSQNDVDNAKTIAIIAIIVAAIGLIVGVGGVLLGRRRSA
jgi:periplasmic copper chaperone A